MTIIRVIDLETTGLEPPEHTVCEIAWWDVVQEWTGQQWNWMIREGSGFLVNPCRDIPPEASAIHHLVDEDFHQSISWQSAAAYAVSGLSPSGATTQHPTWWAAHNANFEQKWCVPDLFGGALWICTYKCALRLWPQAPSHSNQALRYWLKPAGLDRNKASLAHRAWPDAYVTAFILREMLRLADPRQLVSWSCQPALLAKCHFGKHRGLLWTDVPIDYLQWILRQGEFDEDVKFTAWSETMRRGTPIA